jgi:hypothetical protein
MRSLWKCECGEDNYYSVLQCDRCGKTMSKMNKKMILETIMNSVMKEVAIEKQEKLVKHIEKEKRVILLIKRVILGLMFALFVVAFIGLLINKPVFDLWGELLTDFKTIYYERTGHYSETLEGISMFENKGEDLKRLEEGLKRTDVKLDRKNNQIIDSINDVYKKSLYIIRQTQEKVIKIRENILEVIKWIGLSKMRWM